MSRLLGEKDALLSLLRLLSPQHSFYTRFGALQLLVYIVEHRRVEVQEYVLTAPGGCSAVLQCLEASPSSSTEIIRNEALLLLPQLVKDSADIQKIVAFEGAFERLLDIIAQEGRIEGGVVVQDALEGLEALLMHNVSNQNYFRETLSIPLLAPLLFYPPPLPAHAPEGATNEFISQRNAFLLQEWDEQKLTNALLLLRCIRHLVDGQGEGHRANQQVMCKVGLVDALAQLALASLAPPLLKAHTLHLLAALLRGSRPTQELFSTMVVSPVALVQGASPEGMPAPVELSWQAPQPAMLCLISLALRGPGGSTDSQLSLGVRAAAVHAFEALVEHNMDIRMTLWHAFVAAPVPEQTHGNPSHLLLDSVVHLPNTSLLTSSTPHRFDVYQYLFASIMLGYLLQGSDTAKEFARRVRLNEEGRCVADAAVPSLDDDEPATLVHVVIGNLAMALREHGETLRRERAAQATHGNSSEDWTKVMVGYLVLLSVWLWQSPESIADFLSESANLQVLVQPAAQSTGVDPLLQGLAVFVLGIAYEFHGVQEHETDGVLTRSSMHPILMTRIGVDQFSTRILAVKSDARFTSCTPETLEDVLTTESPTLWFTWPFVEFWKDNYVRIQKSILVDPKMASSTTNTSTELQDARERLASLQEELTRAQSSTSNVDALKDELAQTTESLALAHKETQAAQEAHSATVKELEAAHASHQASHREWEAAQATLQSELAHIQESLRTTKAQLATLEGELATARTQTSSQALAVKDEDAVTTRALEAARHEAATAQAHAAKLEQKLEHHEDLIRVLHERIAEADKARTATAPSAPSPNDKDLAEQVSTLQSENEDLLVLLDDLMQKRKQDKIRMRDAGWDVSEDEDDEDENDQP
ncbi:Vesicle-mediated ER to Golgi transport protein [Malassezia pachydermatis]